MKMNWNFAFLFIKVKTKCFHELFSISYVIFCGAFRHPTCPSSALLEISRAVALSRLFLSLSLYPVHFTYFASTTLFLLPNVFLILRAFSQFKVSIASHFLALILVIYLANFFVLLKFTSISYFLFICATAIFSFNNLSFRY